MKKITYFFLIFLLPLLSFSKSVERIIIEKVALNAYKQRVQSTNFLTNDLSIKERSFVVENRDTLMVLFEFTNGGFIIISADDVIAPVLAYSTENSVDFKNMAPGVSYWIEVYKNEILALKKIKSIGTDEILSQWNDLLLDSKATTSIVVQPLITAKWNQNKYYNQYSPRDNSSPNGYDNKVPVGCVALAMSMIMYYYRYPESGQGTHTNYSDYGSHYVNYNLVTYDYNAMSDELTTYNGEVSKLIYHCATSVDMMYAADGSGAYTQDVPYAIKSYFKYSNNTSLLSRSSYTQATWLAKIKENLDSKKPLYYAGSSSEGGHAFVCDGYDSDGLCHFNFGWGGSGNGFFSIGTSGNSVNGYYESQRILTNFFPNSIPANTSSTIGITSTSGTIEDGSRVNNYTNNLDKTYILAPSNATSFYINIQNLKSELDVDTLSFWKGSPSNGLLVASYSGDLTNANFTVSTDSLYITFKTNENTTDEGWRINYHVSTSDEGCTQVQIFTTPSGTFSDGSLVGSPYAPETECAFHIRPPNTESITLSFSRFDLSPEDLIEIYDITTSNRQLIDSHTGSTIPAIKTYSCRKILVIFKSDNKNQKDGFVLNYAINTGIKETANQIFEIYPNPSTTYFVLRIKELETAPLQCTLFDMVGKQIDSYIIENSETTIDISNIPSGIYMVLVKNSVGSYATKLIKN